MMRRRLFVGGCGRSGTTYLARCFREAGIKGCPHEALGPLGTVSWYFVPQRWEAIRPPFNATTHKQHRDGAAPQDVQFDHTIHMVRHPLKVIGSVPGIFTVKDWSFITDRAPSVAVVGRSKIARAMRYWYEWNRLMERRDVEFRFQLEDIEREWFRVASLLTDGGVPPPFPEHVSRTTNGKKTGRFAALKLTWDDLRQADLDGARQVLQLAKEYGYE